MNKHLEISTVNTNFTVLTQNDALNRQTINS